MSKDKESEERELFRQEFKDFCENRQKQYDLENGLLERLECAE